MVDFNRALIIRKVHLDGIFDNSKVWEMRSTKTNVRGLVGLIEAGSGMIVGEAIITGCGKPLLTHNDALVTAHLHQVSDFSLLRKWKYPWKLKAAIRFKKPIPYMHPKGAVIWVKLKSEGK